jgi:hypothetical protein
LNPRTHKELACQEICETLSFDTQSTAAVDTCIRLFPNKIAPLSKDLAAGGKRKATPLRKPPRLCGTEVNKLRKGFCLANG